MYHFGKKDSSCHDYSFKSRAAPNILDTYLFRQRNVHSGRQGLPDPGALRLNSNRRLVHFSYKVDREADPEQRHEYRGAQVIQKHVQLPLRGHPSCTARALLGYEHLFRERYWNQDPRQS